MLNEISWTQGKLKPNFIQKGYRIGLRASQSDYSSSQPFTGAHSHAMRINAAQPLRYCRVTAHHQKSRMLQSKQRRKRKKNEQQEELEAFTSKLSNNFNLN